MAPFNRSYTTSYPSVIVSIAVSFAVVAFFDVEEYRNLEI